jgi:hypothetical protein
VSSLREFIVQALQHGLAAAIVAASMFLAPAFAQQVPDLTTDLSVTAPAFPVGTGPLLAIDTAHNNFHTADGRYRPFAELLKNDGFKITANTAPFGPESLKDIAVLVIANAIARPDISLSPFTPEEIAAVKNWVSKGGALLLITDHPPFAGAARDIAASFGFVIQNGFAAKLPLVDEPEIFTRETGALNASPVTEGRNARERITRLTTFGGTVFAAPPEAKPVIMMPEGYTLMIPHPPGPFPIPAGSAKGLMQGAILSYGTGRIAVFGEAGMFSAQIIQKQPPVFFGFNAPEAPQNKQFVLNLVRWLAGALP